MNVTSHTVILSSAAQRDLKRVPPKIVAAIVGFLYGDLAASPRKVGKGLQRELTGSFSARRGPYRVLYTIDDDAKRVEVHRIDHRSDVYLPT